MVVLLLNWFQVYETMIYDEKATMITNESLLKTLCWYDNGWGFAKRLIDTIQLYAQDDS